MVVIGPGISRNEETAEFVRDLVSVCSTSMVIDADGLNAFAGAAEELQPDELRLIHLQCVCSLRIPAKCRGLLDCRPERFRANRIACAKELRRRHSDLRGVERASHRDCESARRIWINTTGNPGMAKGGSGDVLPGSLPACLRSLSICRHDSGWPSWKMIERHRRPVRTAFFDGFPRKIRSRTKSELLREEYGKTKDPACSARCDS